MTRPRRTSARAGGVRRARWVRPVAAGLAMVGLAVLVAAGCSGDNGNGATPDLPSVPRPTATTVESPTTTPSLPVATDAASDAGAVPTLDPCSLVPAAEAEELLGPLADAPVPQSREGRRVGCTYTPSAGPALSLTLDPLSFFDRAATVLAESASIKDDTILVDGESYVAVWFRTPTLVLGVNGPPGSLGEALALAERAERNLPA